MLKRLCLAMVLAFGAASAAQAQRASPMIYELEPAGARSSTVVRLENTQTRPMTVEVVAYEREIAADGTETRKPADADFLVFPPQSQIAAGATQSFRIRYVGAATLPTTKMYVVSLNQVPVQDESAVENVQFVVNFATAAYVTPTGVKADVKATSAALDPSGKQVRVEVKNDGAKYASLGQASFTITDGAGKSFTLTGEPLRAALGLTIVPAGKTRTFTLPVPDGTAMSGAVSAVVKHDPNLGVS